MLKKTQAKEGKTYLNIKDCNLRNGRYPYIKTCNSHKPFVLKKIKMNIELLCKLRQRLIFFS